MNKTPRLASGLFMVAALCLLPIQHIDAHAGAVTIAVNEEPDTLDLSSTSHAPGARISLVSLYDELWTTTPDGEVIPWMAEWESSDDGLQITFTIREGIKFHSGDELTAEDVVFSHERMVEKAPQYIRRARNLESVEALDDRRVRFTFTTPDAGMLPSRALTIVSKAYHERVGEEEFTRSPVGTGPYQFVEYVPGEHLVLARFDDYWGEQPDVEQATFRFVREATTRVSQIQAGEVDMVLDVPYSSVAQLEQAGFGIEIVSVHPTIAVQFQNTNPDVPWYDVRVRRAIAHAIDRDAIVEGLLRGVPERTATVGENELGYDPDLVDYEFDPEKARELLAEAGYPDGFTLPLSVWGGAFAGMRETAEAVTLYLRQVGIDPQVETLEPAQFLGMIRQTKGSTTDSFVGVSAPPYANQSDPVEALSIAYYSHAPFGPYINEELDPLIVAAAAELDNEKRGEILRQAFAILHEDVAIVPLWNYAAVYVMREGIDFTPTQRWFPVVHLPAITLH